MRGVQTVTLALLLAAGLIGACGGSVDVDSRAQRRGSMRRRPEGDEVLAAANEVAIDALGGGERPVRGDGLGDNDDLLALLHQVPQRVDDQRRAASRLLVQALATASAQGGRGQLLTVGTVSRQDGQFSYSPQPPDKLVVKRGEGVVSFAVEELIGELSSVDAFFSGDHRLDFRVKMATTGRLRIASLKFGSLWQVKVVGQLSVAGQRHLLELHYQGSENTERDRAGSLFSGQWLVRGRIESPRHRVDVDESWSREQLRANHAGSVSRLTKRINSRLNDGGDVYHWQDVELRKSFREGKPARLDTDWIAQAVVAKNGKPFAYYGLRVDAGQATFELRAFPPQLRSAR